MTWIIIIGVFITVLLLSPGLEPVPGMGIPPTSHGAGHHLLGFASTLAAVAGYQQVLALNDPVVPATGANEAQIFEDFQIIAGYAGGAANVRTRITTASLALRGSPQIVPIEGTLLAPKSPNFMEMTSLPIQIRQGEPIRCEMESNSATLAACMLWLTKRDHDFSVKHRDLRWVRGTVAVTTVAAGWALGAATVLDEPLEGGWYAVYGMQAFFATAIAARLVFPGQVYRPGCLGQATAVSRSDMFCRGGSGLWGTFYFQALPRLEVLDTAAAAVTYTIWLLVSNTVGIGADVR